MAGNIAATGNAANDIAAIEASFAAGGLTTVFGKIVAPETPLNLVRNVPIDQLSGMARLQGGTYEVAGVNVSGRNTAISDAEIVSASGYGIRKAGASTILFRMDHCYVASQGDGLILDTVAGAWINGNQFNGIGNYASLGSAAVKIGASTLGYEAVDLVNNLTEGYYTAIRVGGVGNCLNLRFSGNRTTNPTSAHYLFAPNGASHIKNVMICEPWMLGGDYAIVLSVAETTGRIERVEVGFPGHSLGITNPGVRTFGDVGRIDYRVSGLISGPSPDS